MPQRFSPRRRHTVAHRYLPQAFQPRGDADGWLKLNAPVVQKNPTTLAAIDPTFRGQQQRRRSDSLGVDCKAYAQTAMPSPGHTVDSGGAAAPTATFKASNPFFLRSSHLMQLADTYNTPEWQLLDMARSKARANEAGVIRPELVSDFWRKSRASMAEIDSQFNAPL